MSAPSDRAVYCASERAIEAATAAFIREKWLVRRWGYVQGVAAAEDVEPTTQEEREEHLR